MSDLLDGVRVVESAVLLNGDTVGMLLGDLGADVIKVESPPRGDYLRYFLGQIVPGVSVAHAQVNLNKRSVLLDLTADTDRATFWRLIDTTGMFVTNRPSARQRNRRRTRGHATAQTLHRLRATHRLRRGRLLRQHPHARMLMNALVGAHAVQRGEDGDAAPRHVRRRRREPGRRGHQRGRPARRAARGGGTGSCP